jgi:hypothetical protein
MQGVDEFVLTRRGDAAAPHSLARHDAKIEQYFAQEFFHREVRG